MMLIVRQFFYNTLISSIEFIISQISSRMKIIVVVRHVLKRLKYYVTDKNTQFLSLSIFFWKLFDKTPKRTWRTRSARQNTARPIKKHCAFVPFLLRRLLLWTFPKADAFGILMFAQQRELDEGAIGIGTRPAIEADDDLVDREQQIMIRLLQGLGDGV